MPKRPVVDKNKEEFMRTIAQEVRMFNKNGEDFQRVRSRCLVPSHRAAAFS